MATDSPSTHGDDAPDLLLRMARIEVSDIPFGHSARTWSISSVDHGDQKGLMVAAAHSVYDPTLHPCRAFRKDRGPAHSTCPLHLCELIDHVAGLLPEERCGLPLVGAREDAGRGWSTCRATPNVWLIFETHTMNRTGSMLACVTKPARHPLGSSSANAVTTYSG